MAEEPEKPAAAAASAARVTPITAAAPPPAADDNGDDGDDDAAGGGPSKKALKKAEAKAKKEAEKARRAAERTAAEAARKTAQAATELDYATDRYGDITPRTVAADAPRVHLRDIGEAHVGQTVKLRAWIQNARMQGAKMAFLELREERYWTIQAVVAAAPETVSRQMVKWIAGLPLESYVLLEAVVKRPLEPVNSCYLADYELHLSRCYCIAPGPELLGLTLAAANRAVSSVEEEDEQEEEGEKKEGFATATLATHLDNPVMHKRAPVQQAIADVRAAVRKLFAEYLDARSFVQFEPPCLIGAASEGGANVFRLPYFGKEAFLAQSPQFYKEIEIAGGRKRVYSISPVFRAENSNTPRHMTEFTGLDLEMEIEDHYHEVLHMLEGVLLHIFRRLKETCSREIGMIRAVYPSDEFLLPEPGAEVRLTFAEGQKLLREEGPAEFRNVSDDEDMSTPQEKALGAVVRKKYKTDFYVIDKFPEGARPFYAMEDPENPAVTNGYDFFMRGQEILSGGQRIHLPGPLRERMRKKGLDPMSPGLKEYAAAFEAAGCPPHGGGGIGLDRVVAWYLNLPSVHLACYYPRTPKRLLP